MTTPPETCPVCGAGIKQDHVSPILPSRREFMCGATWRPAPQDHKGGPWYHQCPHAMTAALRCGSTLSPTERETAREALVAACVEEEAAVDAYDNREDKHNGSAWMAFTARRRNATAHRIAAAHAYLATLEPQQ